jgi:hypothetical protein
MTGRTVEDEAYVPAWHSSSTCRPATAPWAPGPEQRPREDSLVFAAQIEHVTRLERAHRRLMHAADDKFCNLRAPRCQVCRRCQRCHGDLHLIAPE